MKLALQKYEKFSKQKGTRIWVPFFYSLAIGWAYWSVSILFRGGVQWESMKSITSNIPEQTVTDKRYFPVRVIHPHDN